MTLRLRSVLPLLALVACGPAAASVDAGRVEDAGRAPDAALGEDASADDSGTIDDAGRADATQLDAYLPDASSGGPVTILRIVYPAGETISVRGSGAPLTWTAGVDARWIGDGVYELRTTEITAPIEWKPLLDDATWSLGPNYHVEPGQTVEIAPHFTDTTGRVVALADLVSGSLARAHPIWAYFPPVYDENTAARLPVVYMHDGQNLFDDALAHLNTEWGVDETIDQAATAGRCSDGHTCMSDGECGTSRCDTFREAIVIGISNTADRNYEYTPTVDATFGGGGADAYLGALVDTLKPSIDASLRTLPRREDTALLGSSLGGLVSSYGGITHPDTFGLVGAMSPSTWWDDRVLLTMVATIPSLPMRALRVYVDSGDDGVADTRDLGLAYEAAGYVSGTDFDYLVAPGHAHNAAYWRIRLPGALAFLLGPRERIVP